MKCPTVLVVGTSRGTNIVSPCECELGDHGPGHRFSFRTIDGTEFELAVGHVARYSELRRHIGWRPS